jgi:hypothetical protein
MIGMVKKPNSPKDAKSDVAGLAGTFDFWTFRPLDFLTPFPDRLEYVAPIVSAGRRPFTTDLRPPPF